MLGNLRDGVIIMPRETNFKGQAQADWLTATLPLPLPPAGSSWPQPPPQFVECSSMGASARSGVGGTMEAGIA
ncbi:MAG: hypothetical protein WDW36_000099 [Sanguina aurantia]